MARMGGSVLSSGAIDAIWAKAVIQIMAECGQFKPPFPSRRNKLNHYIEEALKERRGIGL